MYQTSEFSEYGYCVDEEFGLADYADEYFSAPQVPTVSGRNLPDFVYNSVHYGQPNSEALYPVMSVVHGGTTYYYYPEIVYLIPVWHYVPESFAYGDPVEYVNPCSVEPNLDGAAEMRRDDACNDPPEDNGDVCPYPAQETPSEAVTSFEIYYEEEGEHLNDAPFNSDDDDKKTDGEKKNVDDKKNEDNGASSLGEKTPMSPDCVNESSAYKRFCSEMEERRKIVGASSQVQKTFVNRGIVKNPKSYENFCCSVADRIKKIGSSSEGKKPSLNRDTVNESSAYIKFCSEVDDRRKILDSPSVIQKSYVNRGIVNDPSAYEKFCRSVEERIKNLRSIDTLPPCGVKKIIDKEGSKGDEENGQKFMDMIMNSAEYLHVQDNIKNPKHYRDLLYRQSLKNNPRRSKEVLFDILPRIIEEPAILDDARDDISCGDVVEIEPQKLVLDEITKPEQPKGKLKSFRKWLSRTFCSCFKTKDPP